MAAQIKERIDFKNLMALMGLLMCLGLSQKNQKTLFSFMYVFMFCNSKQNQGGFNTLCLSSSRSCIHQ